MKLSLIVSSICIFASVMTPPALWASETDELRKEIALLKERIGTLEARLEASEKKTPAAATEKPAPESGVSQIVTSFARDIQVHGFVDASYIFNFNTPVSPNSRTNNLRVFDTDANGFMLNMAEINFEKTVSLESPVGFRIDLDAGQDAKVIHAAGLGQSDDAFDLKQAYVQLYVPFRLPYMYDLDFKIGKYATMHGAELIESVNNWNFSRSYLFGYAIPFTHTGIRAHYKPFEGSPVEGYIGIVNGWDNVVDNNKAKSLEAQVTVTPNNKLSFAIGGMLGPERYNSDKDMRVLADLIAMYIVNDKLTLKINYDYGWERNGATMLPNSGSPSVNTGTPPTYTGLIDKDAAWDGIAVYAKYLFFDWWSIAGRVEYFHDRDGIRTGVLVNNNIPDLDLLEFTLTNEFIIYKNILARLEYRYDKASGQVFTKDKVSANNQSTLAAELIAKF